MTTRRGALALLGLVLAAMLLVGCRDEDLDDVARASRIEAARAEAARLHEGASYFLMELVEIDSPGPFSQAVGFRPAVPRRLPNGLEVRWVIGQAAQTFNGAETPALVSVAFVRRGYDGTVQLLELDGPGDPNAAGEEVAVGNGTGRLALATGEGSSGQFTSLAFEGCGRQLVLTAFGLDSAGPLLTTDELVALGGATRESCDAPPNDAAPRYFLQRLVDLPDLAEVEERAGLDAVLPSYLPAGVTPTWVTGEPLLPDLEGGADGRGIQVVYGLDGGTLLLSEDTRRRDVSAGEPRRIGDHNGRLLHEGSEALGADSMLMWEACGLNFTVRVSSFQSGGDPPPLADDELVRIAESMLAGCE